MNSIEKLIQSIKQHNLEYRKGTPSVSDNEYDALVDQLKTLDPNNEWFKHTEPSPITSSRKVSLPIPMKSLNKVKSLTELKKWCQSLGLHNSTQVVCMPKFDGLSLLHDELTNRAFSRGGVENEGQDCSAHYNATGIYTPANHFHYTFGEFIFSRKGWEDFLQHTANNPEENFKSPRNTAAGLLNRDNPCNYLKFATFFRYGTDEQTLEDYEQFSDVIRDICDIFKQSPLFEITKVSELTDEALVRMFKEWSLLYPIDGIVVYINDLNIWKTIGRNSTSGNPLYAIAYKHPDFTDTFETTVKDIAWKANKSGALKPVVNIETVDTGDCNMENPTGYNANWIREHHIAKGTKVLVTRSGGVIPKILQTIQNAPINNEENMWEELCYCPHCGHSTQWNKTGVELICTNHQCPGIQLAKIVFFYTTCNAENMGEEMLAKIYNAEFTSISAILNITFDELMHIEGFAEGLSNIVLTNNRKIMEGLDMATLMHASDCFTGIGKVKAQKILDAMSNEDRQEFYDLNLYGTLHGNFDNDSVTMQNFYAGVAPFFAFLQETNIPILPYKYQTEVTFGKCTGMSVCVSGFRDYQLEQNIQNNGGKIASSVSKNTTHLIVKDKNAVSSKISKAQSLNIPIFTIEEFRAMYLS